jgi:sulfate permease, SulP family
LGMHKRNIAVVITGLQAQPYRMLQRINLIPGLIPESYLFDKVEDCIQWLGEELRQTTGSDQAFFEKLNEVRNENKVSFKYRM